MMVSNTGIAQDKLYLIFEIMKVDNEQEQAYMETEAFWEEIRVQRFKNGDILGLGSLAFTARWQRSRILIPTVDMYQKHEQLFFIRKVR